MFDLSKIFNPSKKIFKQEYNLLPDDEKSVFSNYKHGKCVNYHNDPEIRNAYMRVYHKMYHATMETFEQRENRRQKMKLSDAKRYKETYHLRKDKINARRRERYSMKNEMTLC